MVYKKEKVLVSLGHVKAYSPARASRTMDVENPPCRSILEDWKTDVDIVFEVSKVKNAISMKTHLCAWDTICSVCSQQLSCRSDRRDACCGHVKESGEAMVSRQGVFDQHDASCDHVKKSGEAMVSSPGVFEMDG